LRRHRWREEYQAMRAVCTFGNRGWCARDCSQALRVGAGTLDEYESFLNAYRVMRMADAISPGHRGGTKSGRIAHAGVVG
jgi:hypothetical protein